MLYAKRRRRELVAGKVGEQDLLYPDDFYPSYQFIRPRGTVGGCCHAPGASTRLRPAIPAPSLHTLYGSGMTTGPPFWSPRFDVPPPSVPALRISIVPLQFLAQPTPQDPGTTTFVPKSSSRKSKEMEVDFSRGVEKDLALALRRPYPTSKLFPLENDDYLSSVQGKYDAKVPLYTHSLPHVFFEPEPKRRRDLGKSGFASDDEEESEYSSSDEEGNNKRGVFLRPTHQLYKRNGVWNARKVHSNPEDEKINREIVENTLETIEKLRERDDKNELEQRNRRDDYVAAERKRRMEELLEDEQIHAEIEEELFKRQELQATLVRQLYEDRRERDRVRDSLTGFGRMDVTRGAQGIHVPWMVRYPVLRSHLGLAAALCDYDGVDADALWDPEDPIPTKLGSVSGLAYNSSSKKPWRAAEDPNNSNSSSDSEDSSKNDRPFDYSHFPPSRVLFEPTDLKIPPASFSLPRAKKPDEEAYVFDIKNAREFSKDPFFSSSARKKHKEDHLPYGPSDQPIFFPPRRVNARKNRGDESYRKKSRLPSGKKDLHPKKSHHRRKSTSGSSSSSYSSSSDDNSTSSRRSHRHKFSALQTAPLPPLVSSLSPTALLSPLPPYSYLIPPPFHFRLLGETTKKKKASKSAPSSHRGNEKARRPLSNSPSRLSASSPHSRPPSALLPSISGSHSFSPSFVASTAVPRPFTFVNSAPNTVPYTFYPSATNVGIIPGVHEPPPGRPMISDPLQYPFPPPGSSYWKKKRKEETKRKKSDEKEEEETNNSRSSRKKSRA